MDEKLKEKVDEMKSKGKDLLRKFGLSRSTPTFKGQGHTLGGATQSRSIPDAIPPPCSSINGGNTYKRPVAPSCGQQKAQQVDWRKLQQEKWERERGVIPSAQVPAQRCGSLSSPHNSSHIHRGQAHGHVIESVNTLASAAASVKSPLDDSIRVDSRESRGTVQVINDRQPPIKHVQIPDLLTGNGSTSHFDPYTPVLSSRGNSSSLHGFAEPNFRQTSGKVQCPVCQEWWNSEAEVSAHIDDCTGIREFDFAGLTVGEEVRKPGASEREQEGNLQLDLDEAVATFLSGNPSSGTLETILKVLKNIMADPATEKYRKIRLENQKFKQTVGSATGGLKMLLAAGFSMVGDGQERMLVMGVPSSEQKLRIESTFAYLDSFIHNSNTSSPPSTAARPPSRTIDRQLKIFYAPKDHLEERFELPASFYELTASEVKLEAAARKKKLEDGQLLIPKSVREKKAAAAKRRYNLTVLRVQLPDGLLLQGYFGARESTTALYEFVASTLNDSHETFDLVLPAATKLRVIPRFLEAGGQCLTLEEADLIPKALLKFKPTGEAPFTGLKSEYYGLCEELTLSTLENPVDLLSS